MRITLDIDDDVLSAAREIAVCEGKTVGDVLSEGIRRGLHVAVADAPEGEKRKEELTFRNGIPVLPSRGEIITVEKVQRLVDEVL